MIFVVISEKDEAGVNIKENLLKMSSWRQKGEFYFYTDIILITIPDYHLHHDNIDLEFAEKTGEMSEAVIFASKHRSESGLKTLTVHPIGNFATAELGGRDRELVPPAPHLMTSALRVLSEEAKNLNYMYKISFEATHHGPYLTKPSFFIEIGSDENAWNDKKAGESIARTILRITEKRPYENPVAVGIGGGHYAPRFTELALARQIDFAHIVPNYHINALGDEMIDKIVACANPNFVYFHRKAMKNEDYRRLEKSFKLRGIKSVREKELELL